MYKNLVQKYIVFLKPEHIKEFGKKRGVLLTEEEVLIIYQFLKEHYEELFQREEVLFSLKGKVREEVFSSLYSLYQEYKNY